MTVSQLDVREEHFRIPSPQHGRSLFLRHLPPSGSGDRVVLYVHGGTFPGGLSIAHRLDGRSWRDELCTAGFHVWALDFHGFGRLSEPYPESRHKKPRRSAAPRTPAGSWSMPSASSAGGTGSAASRSSPTRGERS